MEHSGVPGIFPPVDCAMLTEYAKIPRATSQFLQASCKLLKVNAHDSKIRKKTEFVSKNSMPGQLRFAKLHLSKAQDFLKKCPLD